MSSFLNWGKKRNGTYCRASSNAPAKVTAKLKERRRERRERPSSFKPSVRWPEWSSVDRTAASMSHSLAAYRTDRNAMMGKHREQRGFFAIVRAELFGNYPTHLLRTGVFCRLIRTKTHPLLHLSSAPKTLRNSSRFTHQCFPFNPPRWLPAVLSSSTKPSGVTVKWNKNKTDRKLTS